MPQYEYQALTQSGETVSGSIVAPNAEEVMRRIEYLGLIPVGASSVRTRAGRGAWRDILALSSPKPEEVTVFTADLALLLKTGARLNEALELIEGDADVGRLRPAVAQIHAAILSGDTFADALATHPTLFPPVYVALVRIAEVSGTLDQVLEALAIERSRAESLRRKLQDALRYPAFILLAASAVLVFFLTVVLPQFGDVLRDSQAKLDPVAATFLALSDAMRDNIEFLAAFAGVSVLGTFLAMRNAGLRTRVVSYLARVPGLDRVRQFHLAGLFCRNLGILLGSGVTLAGALRILADTMAASGDPTAWTTIVERVRHGGKLSDALAEADVLPGMAVRALRLGEETGQLPMLAGRIAEFYEAKLVRSLDRIVGIVGPAAIVGISVVVGGLIVSVMTALLSVTQVVE